MPTATPEPDPSATPGAAPATRARLEVLSGSRRGEEQVLPVPGEYALGCDEACEVRFDPYHEPFVSARHAVLRLRPASAEIADLDSSNGTRVNGEFIAGPARLCQGDVVELGTDGPRLRFDADGTAYSHFRKRRRTVQLPRRPAGGLREATQRIPRPRGARWVAVAAVLALGLAAATALWLLAFDTNGPPPPPLPAAAAESPDPARADVGRRLARQYGRAIYLLATRVAEEGFRPRGKEIPVGHLKPGGTAWAFDTAGRLATNGHVALFADRMLERYAPHLELVAVQNGTGEIYRVTASRIHPECSLGDMTKLTSDIAVLELDRAVPVALPIADRRACLELAQGEMVYSLGFPIESFTNMQHFYAYDQPERAVATLRYGPIQRLTTGEGLAGQPADRRLVHIGIASSGGQSGSPVISRGGEAVAMLNATAVASLGGTKLPHPGMFTYAVRADALREMLAAGGGVAPGGAPEAAEGREEGAGPSREGDGLITDPVPAAELLREAEGAE